MMMHNASKRAITEVGYHCFDLNGKNVNLYKHVSDGLTYRFSPVCGGIKLLFFQSAALIKLGFADVL